MTTDTSRNAGSAPDVAAGSAAESPHSTGLPSGEARYRLLLEAGQQLSSTLDSEKICERLRSLVSRAIPCDGIVVSSYDEKEGLIRCDYLYSGGEVLDAASLPPLELGPPGTGMQSEVIRSGKSMRFGDVAKRVQDPSGTFMHVGSDGVVHDVHGPEPIPTKSAVMVPILLDGRVTGVVQVMTDQPVAYTDEHLELLEGIVFMLGAAIQNAKLFAKAHAELSERKRAEEALRESEAKFRFLAEAGPAFPWTTDPDFHVQYVSRRWLDLVGLSLEQAVGDGWWQTVHPEDELSLKDALAHAKEHRTEFKAGHRMRLADGAYRWVQSRAQPDIDSGGHITRWFGMTFDIADHKRAEAELEERVKERTEQLEAANREMEGFTYSVSHDLRGPLRAIMSTSMILREDYGQLLPADAKDQLERQARAAHKMGDLIDDLLKLSRIGRQEISRKEIDLSEMAAEVFGELHKDADLVIQPGLKIKADPKLMKLAVQNLLDNAIKFARPGTKPVIQVGQDETGAFFVRDNGIGFNMEYAHKLFMPFERLVLDSEYPGTGIGLANVRRIVERHGGRVWAEGKPDEGSTFYFAVSP